MKHPIPIFFLKFFLISSPVWFLLGLYFYQDPFKVLYHYDRYYESGKPAYVELDKDYTTMETFLASDSIYKYDSYILGSSRSMFYDVFKWGNYVHSDRCFHFDASAESIYGIKKKIEFLYKNNYPIKNALIILDYQSFWFTDNFTVHFLIKHPLLSGQNKLAFQFTFLKAFFNRDFIMAYFDFKITGKIKPYMKEESLLDDRPKDYIFKGNQFYLNTADSMIESNPDAYYAPQLAKFRRRDPVDDGAPKVIKQEQEKMLEYIKGVFNSKHTNYKIVISPLYDQKKMDPSDLAILYNVFGKENVVNFSGKNSITDSIHNYYDNSHYRMKVADSIMRVIYLSDDYAPAQLGNP